MQKGDAIVIIAAEVIDMFRKIFATLLLTAIMFFAQNVSAAHITYQVSVKDYGWMQPVGDGQVAGTVGENRRMEAIVIDFDGIEYNAHVKEIGWQGWRYSGQVAGTIGESRRMEAIRIRLSGRYADKYDVVYRAHIKDYGWLDWVSNGEVAGTTGEGLHMEAIQIRIVRKGEYYDDDYDRYDRDRYNRDRYGRYGRYDDDDYGW